MIPDGALILLDTNIVVHLARQGELGQRIEAEYRLSERPVRPLFSIVTVGELLAFARKRKWGTAREQALRDAVAHLTVVDIRSEMVLSQYAEIDAFSQDAGRSMGQNDIWIAATAVATGAVLLTTDRDFEHLHPAHVQLELVPPQT